jgi:glycosyltransferase involved in cell wall biosynthesis
MPPLPDHSPIAIVIPSRDPDERLIILHKALQKHLSENLQLWIVNDGSQASTRTVSDELQKEPFTRILHHPENRGKGAALNSAFSALLQQTEFAGCITCDCDGQHLPEDVLNVIRHFICQPENLLLGCRDTTSENVPWKSRLGNKFINYLLKKRFGLNLRDSQTGLRAIPRKLMEQSLALDGNAYEFETQMLLQAQYCRIIIAEIPIKTVYIQQNASSHFRCIRDTIKVLRALQRTARKLC